MERTKRTYNIKKWNRYSIIVINVSYNKGNKPGLSEEQERTNRTERSGEGEKLSEEKELKRKEENEIQAKA